MEKRFNIRVYGLWIRDGKVLVNDELIKGKSIVKFPGGGMEYGEGTHDCLKREWHEELGIDIEILGHYYTTDFFQLSAYDVSQIISIYYRVAGPADAFIQNKNENEKTFWLDLNQIKEDTFTLPIDKRVGKMLSATKLPC